MQMIKKIPILKNIGQFDNDNPPSQLALTPFSVIYAENGRGKTTLAAILRSLATGESKLITERHRLGAQDPPHIVVSHTQGDCVF